MKQEIVSQAGHAAPSVGVLTTVVLSVDINFWYKVTAICFIFLQAAYLIYKWYREVKREKN